MYASFFALILTVAGSVVDGNRVSTSRSTNSNRKDFLAFPTANTPVLVERDCSAEAAAFNSNRAEKRGLSARSIWPGPQNTTCILAPESPKENYIAGMPVRSDISGGQDGLEFVLDIVVMNVTTCKPLANTMVQLWSPNAMGEYGNFLRGATTTSSTGITEFRTIYPGLSEGANHVNVAVHTSSGISSSTTHVGKLFFVDRWNELILGASPYTKNTNPMVLDDDDADYRNALKKGYYPVISYAVFFSKVAFSPFSEASAAFLLSEMTGHQVLSGLLVSATITIYEIWLSSVLLAVGVNPN